MSKFHWPHMNFTGLEIINMNCFGTRMPEMLSKKQRVTRLYMAVLRKNHDMHTITIPADYRMFHREMVNVKSDFQRMLGLKDYDTEHKSLMKKWVDFITENFDMFMLVADNRPYSLNSHKYFIFSDEMLMSDPIGYYKYCSFIYGEEKPMNSVVDLDFPLGDDFWVIDNLNTGEFKEMGLIESHKPE